MTKTSILTCVGCKCTSQDPEVQIEAVPCFAMSHNDGYYGICYDCRAMLMAFTKVAAEQNPVYGHNVLVAHGNKLIEAQIAGGLTKAEQALSHIDFNDPDWETVLKSQLK